MSYTTLAKGLKQEKRRSDRRSQFAVHNDVMIDKESLVYKKCKLCYGNFQIRRIKMKWRCEF